jgi:hypothetical protein
MTSAIEYALLAGASYISNRDPVNQFPVPVNKWGQTRFDTTYCYYLINSYRHLTQIFRRQTI